MIKREPILNILGLTAGANANCCFPMWNIWGLMSVFRDLNFVLKLLTPSLAAPPSFDVLSFLGSGGREFWIRFCFDLQHSENVLYSDFLLKGANNLNEANKRESIFCQSSFGFCLEEVLSLSLLLPQLKHLTIGFVNCRNHCCKILF